MKFAIVGSRDFPNLVLVRDFVMSLSRDDIVVSGGARGVDKMAEMTAKHRRMKTEIYLPDWKQHGKAAGFIRNADIIAAADQVIAFLYNDSNGTCNSIDTAAKTGKEVVIMSLTKSKYQDYNLYPQAKSAIHVFGEHRLPCVIFNMKDNDDEN